MKKYTIFLTCLFRAIYSIGFMQTDILTVSVGIIETIGPIPLQIKCYSYLIIVWDEYHNHIQKYCFDEHTMLKLPF